MIATIETGSPKVVGVKLSGKLHDEDYRRFVPMIESILTAEGKVRLFVQFEEFHGMGHACRLGRFQVRPATLFRLRADRYGGRPQMGKVDGERLQAVHKGQGEVFRPFGSRCCLDMASGKRRGRCNRTGTGSEIGRARQPQHVEHSSLIRNLKADRSRKNSHACNA